ncbi:histone deacetylase family protein [Paenochrobactrum sp. BZR 588]|uniref:histone deacetylase family protein n=1 Tax=Paenochrobactrum TaxID=999488 RepID=UPI0035BC80FF
MATRLYWHDVFLKHLTPAGHPERPDRLRALLSVLDEGVFYNLERVEAPLGDEAAILLTHTEKHLETIKNQIPFFDVGDDASDKPESIIKIANDTYVSPQSWQAALTAIGAANAAVDDVFTGQADNIFIASRPPGHHAEPEAAMGFCLFNNAAIAARYAQMRYQAERVAIIDFDVHHGNGTQAIFENDKSVLYCSTHQEPLFPGTGHKNEQGAGNIVNAPLSPESGSREFREAIKTRILPALDNFRPDLILISAGFDAHYLDPLAQINLDESDFDWVTGKIMERADRFCANRLVSILEGGYDLQGLSVSAAAHIKRLMEG